MDDEGDAEDEDREDEETETDARLELSDTDEETENSALEEIWLYEVQEDEWLTAGVVWQPYKIETRQNKQPIKDRFLFIITSFDI